MQPTMRSVFLVTCVLSFASHDVAAVRRYSLTPEELQHLPQYYTTVEGWTDLQREFRNRRLAGVPGFIQPRSAYILALYSRQFAEVPDEVLLQLRERAQRNRAERQRRGDLPGNRPAVARNDIPDTPDTPTADDDQPPEYCSDTDDVYFLLDDRNENRN